MNGKVGKKNKKENSRILKVNGKVNLNSVDIKLELKNKTKPPTTTKKHQHLVVWCFNALKWNLMDQSSQVVYCSYF